MLELPGSPVPDERPTAVTSAGAGPADDVSVVFGWMQRVCPDRGVAEDLTVEVFRRLAARQHPRWLAGQPPRVAQRFSSVCLALELRGVL